MLSSVSASTSTTHEISAELKIVFPFENYLMVDFLTKSRYTLSVRRYSGLASVSNSTADGVERKFIY